jgi:hypothetical protein
MVTFLTKQSQNPKSMQSESTLKSVANHNSNKTKHKSQKTTIMQSKLTLKSAKKFKIYNKTR